MKTLLTRHNSLVSNRNIRHILHVPNKKTKPSARRIARCGSALLSWMGPLRATAALWMSTPGPVISRRDPLQRVVARAMRTLVNLTLAAAPVRIGLEVSPAPPPMTGGRAAGATPRACVASLTVQTAHLRIEVYLWLGGAPPAAEVHPQGYI